MTLRRRNADCGARGARPVARVLFARIRHRIAPSSLRDTTHCTVCTKLIYRLLLIYQEYQALNVHSLIVVAEQVFVA